MEKTEQIQVKGIELLDEKEKKIADKLLDEYYTKVQRKIKNLTSLKIHIKEYNKDGKRKKYSINAETVSAFILYFFLFPSLLYSFMWIFKDVRFFIFL